MLLPPPAADSLDYWQVDYRESGGVSMQLQNRLLAAIPPDVHERLSRYMRTVELANGQVLHRPNQDIERVYSL